MGSNLGFSLGGIGKELEWNNIYSYIYKRKGSLLIQGRASQDGWLYAKESN